MNQTPPPPNFPIQEIDISDKRFEHYEAEASNETPRKVLSNLSKINIFVGPNNSGKSRFMREIAKTEKLIFKSALLEFKNYERLRISFQQDVKKLFETHYVGSIMGFPEKSDLIPDLSYVAEGDSIPTTFRECVNTLKALTMNQFPGYTSASRVGTPQPPANPQLLLSRLVERAQAADRDLNLNVRALPDKLGFNKLYFPTLRGLRVLDSKNTDYYAAKTRADYFYEKTPVEIFSGLGMYEEVRKHLLGSHEKRTAIKRFEEFLSKSFYDGEPLTIIPREDKSTLYVKIGNEEERPIHDLGDGVQAIITLTFPLFIWSLTGTAVPLVFFEEPEIYMHPGMQRLFLQTLSCFEGFQFFMTTHSNHLLDITLDVNNVSLFTFSKHVEKVNGSESRASFKIENMAHGSTRSLELLGVRASSVFLTNCTVWVEGVTDRRYLRRYLELLIESDETLRRFTEDLHFSFVEYGGANITHWSFLEDSTDTIRVDRLCAKLFLIADSDNATEGAKAKRHKELIEKLGERFLLLPCREIENLLSPKILRCVVSDYEGGSSRFSEFQQEDYRVAGLGEFIETKVLATPKKRRGSYREESGTIRGKLDFCETALQFIKSFSDLSSEAQLIARKIYNFIESQNN